ncbi:MAG: hypothetical protein HY896_08450 [Deltaproteobacteria bacterium]|nr:hypothetical protein [Deltaproteobacteria bacterium]
MKCSQVKWAVGITAAFVLLAAQAGPGRAAGFTEPKAEYSADQYISGDGKTMKSKVYHAPKKERMDIEEGGEKQYIITRLDRKVVWIVMPGQNMYMERNIEEGKNPAGDHARDIRECSIDRKAAGNETVNGVSASRSRVRMSCPDGVRYTGDIWESKDGIMVKMDAVAEDGEKGKTNLKIELKNLKIRKLDPGLFEVPAGFRQMKMPFGAMPGAGGGMDMRTPAEAPEAASSGPSESNRPEPAPEKEKGAVEKGTDAVKKLKGLFKW